MPNYNDLTGAWKNNADNGTYFLRQINEGGTTYFAWYGEASESSCPQWTNVAMGRREGDCLTVRWCDVPKGQLDAQGSMPDPVTLEVSANPLCIRVTSEGGGWFSQGPFVPKS